MPDPSTTLTQLLRTYTALDTEEREVTHCLSGHLPPQINVFKDASDEDLEQLSALLQHARNRFVDQLPGAYRELKEVLLPALEERLAQTAAAIDKRFALPKEARDLRTGFNKLEGLRKLKERLSQATQDYGETAVIAEAHSSVRRVLPALPPLGPEAGETSADPHAASEERPRIPELGHETVSLETLIPPYANLPAEMPLEEALEEISARLERDETWARTRHRTYLWLWWSVLQLREVLAEYEVYGEAAAMTFEEAKELASGARGGKPSQIDKEAFGQKILHLLKSSTNAWHTSGPHAGKPNKGWLFNEVHKHDIDLLTKDNGEVISKRYGSRLVGQVMASLREEDIDRLRTAAGYYEAT